ncbi:MAG: gliding motility-associated C-terminal domain-containing protein [Bacteroidia bacterium]|nr:gliding motility-associated C-terminal domain-containing protein [Bacteroidia bacterium]
MKKIILIFLLFVTLGKISVIAQNPTACPYVVAVDDTLGCGSCTNLNANFFGGAQTTSYTVNQIPYTPYTFTGGTAILINIDDTWSGTIALPFPFCFFGNTYNQCVIGSNGIISFDLSFANGYCQWGLTGVGPIPTANCPTNAIMGPYHDIDPGVGGSVTYQVLGSAPCRRLVVNWNQVPMFQCNNLINTQQTILYETTNVIETYIANKPICASWNGGGLAIHGIQNQGGTQAFAVPGRNNTVFAASNDAWQFTPSGGAANFTLNWYQNGNLIGSGNNTVQVCPSTQTDYVAEVVYNGCAGQNPVTVYDTTTIYILNGGISSSSTNVTCFGAADGTATVTYTGSPVTTYSWSPNVSTTAQASNLAPGTYIVNVNDPGGCTGADTIQITEPPQLTVAMSGTDASCAGVSNGTAQVVANGGTGTYTYTWNTNPPQYTSSIQNLSSGMYSVTVVDANNCSVSGSFTVNQPQALTFSVTNTPETCGNANGTATATISGGTSPYSYSWNTNPAQLTQIATGLVAGTYTIYIQDAQGCTVSASTTITMDSPVAIQAVNTVDVLCNGGNTGSAVVVTQGGVQPFTFNWTTPSFSGNTAANTPAGNYSVTVTDSNGCAATQNFVINQPPALTFSAVNEVDILCFGNSTGSASASVVGGVTPYNFNWTNNSSDTSFINNISAGNYTLTVTDAHNCVITQNYSITEPPVLTISSVGDTICLGSNSGTGYTIVGGGVTPYNYNWNPPVSTTSTGTNLSGGFYDILVTDANGCTISTAFSIRENTNPAITSIDIENVDCFGNATGSATVNIQGGTPPFVYNWNPSVSSSDVAENLTAGNYSLTISDAIGCFTAQAFVVTEPALLTANASGQDLRCFEVPEGVASVTVNGGTLPYIYEWNSHPPQKTATAIELPAGDYSVTVTDAHNCLATASVSLYQPSPIKIDFVRSVKSYCGLPNASITVTASGGTNGLTYSWENGMGFDSVVNNIYAGDHIVYVTDEANCVESRSFGVNDIPKADAYYVSTPGDADSIFLSMANVYFQNETEGGVSFEWYMNNELFSGATDHISHRFTEHGEYNVMLVAYNGSPYCPDTFARTYHIIPEGEIYFPNAFTPNGDGVNDTYWVGGNRIVTFTMTIYDRWGKEITTMNALGQEWNGKTKEGKDAPEGVYTFKAIAVMNTGISMERSGTITLIR